MFPLIYVKKYSKTHSRLSRLLSSALSSAVFLGSLYRYSMTAPWGSLVRAQSICFHKGLKCTWIYAADEISKTSLTGQTVYELSASGKFSHLLLIFSNSLNPGRHRAWSWSKVLINGSVPEGFFGKVEKRQHMTHTKNCEKLLKMQRVNLLLF